jgi:hypothetical protein
MKSNVRKRLKNKFDVEIFDFIYIFGDWVKASFSMQTKTGQRDVLVEVSETYSQAIERVLNVKFENISYY